MDGKQLRNSILQWAIQGKLVPQDPNDEPASVLLERIREEKARLVKEKKIKRDKNESIIYRGDDNSYYEKYLATGEVKCIDDEIPFNIPKGWQWCRIRRVLHVWSARRVHEKDWRKTGVPFYRAREIGRLADFGYVNNDLFIDKSLYDEFSASGVPNVGDLLITAVGTLGKVYIVNTPSPIYFKDGSVLCFSNYSKLNPTYLKYAIESPMFVNQYIGESQGTTVATLTMVRVNEYLIPIPPLKEQGRIVTALANVLPIVQKYSVSKQRLDSLNENVKPLMRKSILQEAIQGRLVAQCETDEPASVLLKKISAEKERLLKEGKLKKSALTDSLIFKGDDNKYYENLNGEVIDITDQIPFDIPTSWQWVRLRTLCYITTGASFKKEEASAQGENKVRILRGGNILPYRLLLKGDDIFIDKELVKENILLRQNDLVTPAVTSLENICKMARVEQDYDTITMGGFVFIIRGFYNNKTLAQYLQCVFSSPTTIEFVRSITNKSGQAFYNIGKERLSNTLIPIPPFEEMGKITSRIETLFQSLN